MKLSVHVVDCANGVAATDVGVLLRAHADAGWREISCGTTGPDGSLSLWKDAPIEPGVYQLLFDLDRYFAILGTISFYPRVIVEFRVSDPDADLHLPLIATSNSYTAFRSDS